jgi:hypothetical protein
MAYLNTAGTTMYEALADRAINKIVSAKVTLKIKHKVSAMHE